MESGFLHPSPTLRPGNLPWGRNRISASEVGGGNPLDASVRDGQEPVRACNQVSGSPGGLNSVDVRRSLAIKGTDRGPSETRRCQSQYLKGSLPDDETFLERLLSECRGVSRVGLTNPLDVRPVIVEVEHRAIL